VSHRRFVLFGIGGVVALVIAITIFGLNENLTYYLYPTEAVDQRQDFPEGERFRLAGMVVAGSISENDGEIRFEVSDGGATIPISLTSTPPPLFGKEVPVLLEGSWEGNLFVSDSALIRHDENYEVPEEGGAFEG
jgi:cytochrome c-type biogenesis protein CcmE